MNVKLGLMLKPALRVTVAALLCAGVAAQGHAQVKIRVGSTVSTDVSSAAFCLANKNGAFKKAGLDIELKSFVQSNQKYDAFKGGALDMDINMGAINAAQLYSSGVPMVVLRAVSPADIWAVVVKPDSTLKSPADFKGKKYGVVSLSGTNYGTTFLSFKADGVDLIRDVKVSTLPPANLVTALEKGEIDGGTIYEPYLTTALKANRVKILFRPGDLYQKRFGEPFLALVISARKEFVEKNRAAAGKFISVMEDTLANLNSNLDAAAQAHSECIPETKLTAAETKEYLLPYAPNVIKTRNEPAMVKSAQNLYDRLLEAKQLQQPVKAADFWVKP